jgi:hypothetical protein
MGSVVSSSAPPPPAAQAGLFTEQEMRTVYLQVVAFALVFVLWQLLHYLFQLLNKVGTGTRTALGYLFSFLFQFLGMLATVLSHLSTFMIAIVTVCTFVFCVLLYRNIPFASVQMLLASYKDELVWILQQIDLLAQRPRT